MMLFRRLLVNPNKNFVRTLSSTTEHIPLLKRCSEYNSKPAITNPDGNVYTYADIFNHSSTIAKQLLQTCAQKSIQRQPIAFLCNPGFNYVATQFAIWRIGGIAVPLCNSHPPKEISYVLNDSKSVAVVYDDALADRKSDANVNKIPEICLTAHPDLSGSDSIVPCDLVKHDKYAGAMIIYTSGTTGPPKGVVTTHFALETQINDLVSSWGWDANDRILHFLPLHHVHGVVNKLACALSIGGHVEFMEKFDPTQVWERLANDKKPDISVFMGVPTVYSKLIAAYDSKDESSQQIYSNSCKKLRLMVSGSAALPVGVFKRWENISGHRLLERYGMTEFGMGISNPLHPTSMRRPGYVGKPLPSCEVKLIEKETGEEVEAGSPGALLIKGDNVFREYWQKPEATAKEFDKDGWFITGDVGRYDPEVDSYQILGRSSVDIIKSAGYKISALHLEQVLLDCSRVLEIAILGVASEINGQDVVALVVPQKVSGEVDETIKQEILDFATENLPRYSIPRSIQLLDAMPRNAMGKVNKKALLREFFDE